jgi:uncharacterized protein YndB with AHSA1/START domain
MSIIREIIIESSIQEVWRAWTQSQVAASWLAPAADIEPFEGGKYELYWDPSNKNSMSTKGCRILSYQEPNFLKFNWKGPDQFAQEMNEENHLTDVCVRLEEDTNGTKVILEHSGWGHTEEWVSAEQWHAVAWEQLLSALKSNMESKEIN